MKILATILVALMMVVEYCPNESVAIVSDRQIEVNQCGPNIKPIVNGLKKVKWFNKIKFAPIFKSCARPTAIEREEHEFSRLLKNHNGLKNTNLSYATGLLGKKAPIIELFEDMTCMDDIAKEIEEQLRNSYPGEYGKIKIMVYPSTNTARIMKTQFHPSNLIRLNSESLRLSEFDFSRMEEYVQKGLLGKEEIVFEIPKKPRYILDGAYSDRVSDNLKYSMVKDDDGNWKKFRKYMRRLKRKGIGDMAHDEFARDMYEMGINIDHVVEVEELLFVELKLDGNESVYASLA